jgi:hypothetical protein
MCSAMYPSLYIYRSVLLHVDREKGRRESLYREIYLSVCFRGEKEQDDIHRCRCTHHLMTPQITDGLTARHRPPKNEEKKKPFHLYIVGGTIVITDVCTLHVD